ncbi:MAG: T9SS type B sorting domain-containing protein [Muricauda sp.]|nr:T9SS type B sorting domain-containing protein [Allomuricauda sp.]MBO6587985.1 T9SS type B sorting domain-containing protein [Allomuricauda sp.]MBO6617610.1 T9SS type B sorting domain-containing protein [Allomuricauda sp.]MBO6643379.1 T9SS type B sorting domain-containing protein [Allomuricauda sp.]MBO6745945.1 T9SS type B sorting domain-containing protein [Allomuricauda sp.]MBO6843065.1 T9SS type B sorting domain-containing protein [Allomuricauda sp.]
MNLRLLKWGTTICILFFAYTGMAQIKNDFDVRYENELRGDLTFIANNIVNRDEGGNDPEDPYNSTGWRSEYNDRLNMQYIDIDGDPSTFSSSSATLAVPDSDCSLIRYAGLYWSAVYRDNNRSSDFNQVKFRVPGGSYVDLTADEILFDGEGDADFGSYAPYACYKDVTSILTGLANPDGEYFVANVRASSGDNVQGGVSGGWSLVVVYENPTLPGKYITTFDGYAGIKSGETVDIPFSGFTTLPAPFPVNAKLGVAALEGDNRISGDQLAIRADSNGSFTTLSNTANPSNNFFNSNITDEGVIQTNRNPNSVNTLGWDVDLFTIPNPSQSVIPNSETGATLRASSSQDKYDIFFTSLDVEIIEPLINLAKTVEDIGGNDITGQGVNLGQYLDYVLTFQNVGNDDAVNYTIRDILPLNVTLDESSITMPAGVTYTYDPSTRTVLFTVPDNIIEEGDPAGTIRMRVQVAENCFDFVDACTDIIQNLAYSTYQGAINSAQITDDPSVSEFNGCGFGTPGATNFLLDDLSACNFSRTVQLCGDDVLLDAGDNFDNYVWYRDVNGNNTIDVGTDTVITDGDSDNDPSTMLVSEIGTYIVDKQVADPCKDFQEIITVELFGSVQSNPISALINDTTNTIDGDIEICPNDGSELPEIFLCGLNDTELIQINIPDATSIVWEQLDEASCGAAVDGCANTNTGCTWNTVDTGNDFLASDTGQYRLVINYQNGCFTRFYFNVYKNPLDPQYTSSDIICDTDGNITVTNMPLTYEFQLVDQSTGTIVEPYQSSPSFDIDTNGAYMVEMRQAGVTDGCVFVLDNIGILRRDFQVDVVPQDTDCNGLGEIAISVLNVEAQYYYEISQGGTVVDTHGPTNDNNYTFVNLNDGVYDVSVTTDDGCDYTEQVTIQDLTDLELTARISQHITCREGNIQMESTGGKTPHTYAIWSYVDEDGNTQISYPSVQDIPASAYQTSQIFDILDPGQYTFVVVDRNNCHDISNTVTIEFRPAADFDPTTVTDVLCYGDATGAITFNLISSNGYQLTYYLFDATGFDEDNFDINNALATNASGNFPGLTDGDYVVVINQRKGSADCDYFEYSTISAPSFALDADAVLTQDYTCLQNGIIEAQNVTGGTAPYKYSIDGVTFGASPIFNNLTDGTYTVTVRDANGCIFVTNSIAIDPLDPPTDIDFSATNPQCPTFVSDVTLSVTGGTPNLVYEIISPAGSAINNGNNSTFTGLAPGTYMFRVTDNDGCFYDESFTIAPVTEISVTGQLNSNITCFGDSDGEIQYTVSNFNTDYDYSVTGPAPFSGTAETNGTISFTGLAEGTYTITVTDNFTNCTDTADVTIAAPPAAITAPFNLVQPTCVADGSIDIAAAGGWGSYTYEITAGPATFGPQSNGLFSGLSTGGTYTYTVTDSNGCVFTDTFTIIEAVAPVLDIVPNDICYDDATGLTLTANVTSGGDGNYEYSLNGGPFVTNNTFNGLGPGTYTIDVRDGNDCTDSAAITIDPELSVVASAPNITACATDTDITITAAGGDGNYVYAVVADGVTPTVGDFAATNPVTVTSAGDYDVYVRDNYGASGYCEANYDITIIQDDPLAISITNTDILCSGESQAQITITATGGEGPYLYSIDNGANYQTSNTFVNLPAGSYNVRVRDANNCEVTEIYTITEPLTLSASAAVTALAECYPGMGAEVRITNAIGGTAPYEYSFDGGSNYGASSIGYLMPGTHTLYIRDANLCTYPMTVTIDPEPTPPNATTTIDYECDGEGTITVTPDSADFDYTYEIDGSPNTPDTSNVFNNVAVGNHTITVNYTSNLAPSPSVLLSENFGVGPNTSISEIDPAYCYEPQDGSVSACGFGTDTHIQDGEYSVTQTIVNPYGSWLSPNDHTGLAGGRFLAINVGGVAGVGGIVYQKTGVEVIPNRDITVSLHAFNLLRNGTGGGDPSIEIQLVDGGGTIIASTTTGNIPKNTGVNDWHNYSVNLNPGANSNLDIVIRTNSAVVNGNDIAIDDIEAYQIPEVCTDSLTLNVTVEDGHAFDGAITAYTDLTCNSAADGTITFEAENFDPATGFTYQVDGGAVSAAQFASPITVTGLAAGAHTINIVDLRDPACAVVLNQTLTQPDVLDVTASITNELTCTNGGATITATATGGTPTYQYQLEDDLGAVITAFQSSNVFTGVAAGDYVVRARDINLCEDTTTVITVDPPATIVFTTTPTACYSGNNDGSIQVDVTDGNGNYQFSLNGGPWITPTPSTATTHTFSSLTAGTYTIDVRDEYGCAGVQQTVTIEDALVATVDVVDVSTCADGSITVTASGGTPALEYAFVPTTTDPTGLFSTTNTYTVTAGNEGTFDVYVRDNSATVPYCEYMETVTVNPAVPLTMTNTPTDPNCYNGTGNILVDITSGVAPYTIEIVDLDNGGASNQTDTNVLVSSRTYYNLMPGDYTINVTDASGCIITDTQTINNPDELTGVVSGITPATCTGLASDFGFGFSGYPTTLGTIEFSDDGGTTWIGDNSVPGVSDQFTGYNSGDTVYPSMRTVDGSGNTICQTDLPPFIIPYPLDDLDITISALIVNCNELQVTVQGSEGAPGYEYAYSDDPANFDPATATWNPGGSVDNLGNPVTAGHGMYQWTGLVPGRTYVFYVRDSGGCVRQSNVNVNDLITVPLEITSASTPSCAGLNNGTITYTVTDNQAPFESQFRWNFYDMSSGSPVLVNSSGIVPYTSPQDITLTGLPAGNYYIEVIEVDGSNNDSCVGATENLLLEELDPLSGTPVVLQDISCNAPGLIQIQNPLGGGGIYTYTVTGPAGFTTITSTSDNPIEIPANSPAGNYDVTMEDQYGCGVNLGTVPLTLTPNPTIDSVLIDSCSIPITVTINATTTAAQVFYSLDGGATYLDNGGIFTNVSPGTYNVAIIDSNGCTDTDVIDVYPPLEFTAIQTVALDCEPGAAANAEIEIEVISGSGNYEYVIDGPGANDQVRAVLPSNPFTWTGAAAAGSYEVIVFDMGTAPPNCSQTITIDVPDAPIPDFTETHVDVSCFGGNDGSITLTAVDNGILPLNYTLIPMPAGAVLNGNTFENLPAGTYDVRAVGTNSCPFEINGIVINEPAPISVPAPTVVEFACTAGNNRNNATITVDTSSITGGSGNYVRYEFINNAGSVVVQSGSNPVYTSTDINGGNYTINVYDSNGCLGTTTAVIAPFDRLDSATVTVDAVATCVTGEDITITAIGSITDSNTHPANYEFRELPSGAFQASGSFTGLSVGTHNFEVRNTVTGCIITVSHEVADPEVLDLNIVNTTDITCFGDTNGTVELNLVDSSSVTYASATSYTLYYDTNNTPTDTSDDTVTTGSDADGNFTITGLAAGTYYIEVTDTNPPGSACLYSESFTIAGPAAAITGATVVTDITCLGNDGAIQITNVAGGWGGYSYYVGITSPTGPGDYVASPNFTGLSAGTYEAWVIDSSGCEQLVDTAVLVDPTPITATLQVNVENCTNLQGEIQVVGTAGGQGSNYTYQLIRNGATVGSPQTSTVFSGLGAGSYEVLVADQWSCTTTVGPVVLTDAMTATTTVDKPIDCSLNPGGEITVNVSGGSSNLTFDVVYPDGITTDSNITGVFTGLTQPGVYTFTVTDNNTATPCTYVVTQELDDKVDPVIDNVLVDDVNCFGGSDGSLTVVLDPATVVDPVYTYELYEMSDLVNPYRFAQSSPVFDNLPAGDYRVRVISSRECDDTFDATVGEPSVLNANATATPFVCSPSNSVNESTITVVAAGGTAPYAYSFNGNSFTSSAAFDIVDNGTAQTINYVVRDANGCEYPDSIIVQPLNAFTLGINQDVAITCANPETVTLTVTESIGGDTYTFELLPVGNPFGSLTASTATTATFDLTQPGSYTFRATNDTTGCYVETTHTIAPYDTIDVVATATSPAICFGDAGTIEINVSGYVGAYDYEVFQANGTTTGVTGSGNTSTNPFQIPDPTAALVGGNYFVEIVGTNAPFCPAVSGTITIVSPSSALDYTPQEVANVTCTNDQGEILIAPTGGYAPYDIVLTNTTTSQVYTMNNVASYVFTGLSAGDYTVSVTDNGGCTEDRTIPLIEPTPITADIDAAPIDLLCYGAESASVWAHNVAGGSGSYVYQLNYYDATGANIVFTTGEQSSNTFNGLGAGIYSITVSDGWNCGVETPQVTITEPTEVMASLIEVSAMTCNNNAEIMLNAVGGTAPYFYSTDGINFTAMSGGDTHTFNVGPGAYQYYVRDANGCDALISNQVTVDAVPPLTLNIDDSAAMINCMGEASATITAQAIGGLGNYSYELFGDAALTNLINGPQPSGTFGGLMAGDYYVRVTSDDCVEVSQVITIVDPEPLVVEREEFTNITCSGENDGTITVEVSGGTGEILYAISPNLDQFDTMNTFTDLEPGIYDVIAQDVNGCFIMFQFEITQPDPVVAEAINIMDEVCFESGDGSFELQVSGGTAPYETSLNSTADSNFVQDQFLFQNVPAGTHVVFVRDAQGCETNVIVEINPGVNLAATVTPMYECTGNVPDNYLDIVMEDESIANDLMYALDSTDPADMQLEANFTNMAPGDHYITIAHSNGCMTTYDFTIDSFEPLTLTLENNTINQITAVAEGGVEDYTFYFNGVDNGSDNTYFINRTDTYTVTVVDENGCEATAEIFMEFIDVEFPNFFTPDGDGRNDLWLPDNIEGFPDVLIKIYDRYGRVVEVMARNVKGWDGNYDGKPLPTGDYWYVVQLQGEQDNREFVGHFTLYR